LRRAVYKEKKDSAEFSEQGFAVVQVLKQPTGTECGCGYIWFVEKDV